ncbi:MAG: hypothetical protein PHI27_05690 [Eubacteriales bacterium]|nr:hypothetical protein [Eubacteriales bacterium]
MKRLKQWYGNLNDMKKVCYWGLLLSFLVLFVSKHACLSIDNHTNRIYINWDDVAYIVSGLCLGFIASAVVALLVENSNTRLLNERNKYVKLTILRDFSIEIDRILSEFSSGGERQIDYIPYHFDHLTWSITSRILPFAHNCDTIIDKYSILFSREEIEAIDTAKRHALSFGLYSKEPWATNAKSLSTDLVRLYEHKVLGIKSQYRMGKYTVQQLDEFVETLSKDLDQFQNALISIKQTMPYIFDR